MAIDGEPKNLKEKNYLSNTSKWKLVMQREYETLIGNGTWKLIPMPKGHKAVKCKWVFCTK